MKKNIFLLLLIIFTSGLNAFSQAAYDLMTGFATMNGGTTGGQGGTIVTVTNLADFQKYAATTLDTAYTILVSGHIISGDDKGGSVKVASNKTIIGIGNDAFLDGIGITINGKKNVIVRNIKFTLTSITNTTDPVVYSPLGDEGRPQILVNSGDCITITGSSSNVWIDHCEFFQIDPTVQTNQDLYDGLIDVKASSSYITISWCYFHDHHKCHLVGSSDTDNYNRLITFHHNYYNNISERTPSYRFGHAHVFNNYYSHLKSSGVNSRMGACLRVESNYFENSKDPVVAKNSTAIGYWDLVGNLYVTSTGSMPATSNCSYTPPYNYSSVLQNVNTVKDTVLKYAGTGIIGSVQKQLPVVKITSPATNTSFTGPVSITMNANATAGADTISKVEFYNGSTLLGTSITVPYSFTWDNVVPGTYSITAMATDQNENTAISVPVAMIVNTSTGLLNTSYSVFSGVYPNPTDDVFNIKINQEIKKMQVYNMIGELMISLENILPGQEIEIGKDLQKGIYMLAVQYSSDKAEVIRLIKIK
jgi:pectate lyase